MACPSSSVCESTLPAASSVLTKFPRMVQLEHPDPVELDPIQVPPTMADVYDEALPNESVVWTVVFTRKSAVGPPTPATTTPTGPVGAPGGTVATIWVCPYCRRLARSEAERLIKVVCG